MDWVWKEKNQLWITFPYLSRILAEPFKFYGRLYLMAAAVPRKFEESTSVPSRSRPGSTDLWF